MMLSLLKRALSRETRTILTWHFQGAITIPIGSFECLGMLIIPRNSLKFRLLVDSNPTLPPVFFDGLAQCSQIGYTRTHYEYYAAPVRGPEPIRAHA
jgi:hypothetical protein